MADEQQTDLGDIFPEGGTQTSPADQTTPPAGDQTTPPSDQTTTPTPPADQTPSFMDRMRDAGFADLPDDEAAARDRLLEAFTTNNTSMQTMQDELRQMREAQAATTRLIQQAAPPAPQATKQDTPWPQIPAANLAAWERHKQGEAWRDGTPPSVIDEYAAFQAATEDWTRRLLYTPQEALRDPIRHELTSILENTFGCKIDELPGRMDLDGRGATSDRMYEDASPFLYQANPLNNQPDVNRLTEYGQLFADAMAECQEFAGRYGGQASQADQIEYAYKKTHQTLESLKSQNGQSRVQGERAQRQTEHRQQTRGGPASGGTNRGGNAPPAIPPAGGSGQTNLAGIGQQFADSFVADGGLG